MCTLTLTAETVYPFILDNPHNSLSVDYPHIAVEFLKCKLQKVIYRVTYPYCYRPIEESVKTCLCLIIASFGIPGLAAPPPKPCDGKSDGIHPNPADSKTFFSCSHGIAYHKRCPVNQVFDPNVKTCVLPSTLANRSSTPNGLFPNPDDQTTFYNCGHGIPHHQRCQGNLVFDPNVKICDISTTNPNHCAGRTDGKFPKAGDPKRFYQCVDQKTFIGTCPGSLVFAECCSCCNWPTPTTETTPNPTTTTVLTTTTSSPTTTTETPTTTTTSPITTSPTTITPTTTTTTTTSSGNGCLEPNGVFANPKNPNSFLNCANGIAYEQPCHGQSVFKQECGVCVDISVQCSG